jgi:hypothetical protein
MGLGIVLLFWGIVGIILASAAAAILAAVVYAFDRRHGLARRGWVLTAAAVPFVSLGYAAAGFAAYAVYCEVVRDVDLGIGDSWRVPLGHGYRLIMIDTPDQAFVESPTGVQLHMGLARIGTTEDLIVGEDAQGLFVIDGSHQTEHAVAPESGLRGIVLGGSGQLQLVSPDDFYNRHRWGMPDVFAAIAIIVPPFLLLIVLAWRFVLTSRAAQKPLPARS